MSGIFNVDPYPSKEKDMRRFMLALATVAALPAAPARSQTDITMSYALPLFYEKVTVEIVNQFMKENPDIKVTIRAPAENYPALLEQTLRDSISNTLPDVSFQSFAFTRTLAERQLAVPLDKLLGESGGLKKFGISQSVGALGEWKGQQYAIPYTLSVPIIFYNEDLIQTAGGDPKNFPKTWDGIIDLAGKIKALPDPKIVSAWLQYNVDDWLWQALVMSHGGRMATPDESKVAFDGPEGQASMNILNRLAKDGGMPNIPRPQAVQAFSAGTMGMIFTSSGLLEVFDKQAQGKFKIGTAPMPTPSEKGGFPTGGTDMVMFAKDPEKQKAGWKLIQYMVSPWAQTMTAKATGLLPASTAAIEDPNQLGTFYKEKPGNLTAVNLMPKMQASYSWPGANGLKIVNVILNQSERVVAQQTAPKEALDKLTKDVQALLPK
jgi:multiple sugar transport system substrate-binding protein